MYSIMANEDERIEEDVEVQEAFKGYHHIIVDPEY